MFRRPMVGRRGPGLLGAVARTAVAAGTATAVSRGVSHRMDDRAEEQQMAAAYQQEQAQPAQPAPSMDEKLAQLERLGQLQQQGVLTAEEFEAQKARILGA